MTAALECPGCGRGHAGGEHFCESCGMPLVHAGGGEEPADPSRRVARKIDPELTEGELVRVAGGRNQAEAEFIQGLLLEEGVPSILRRSAGFDVPDMLAAGPRDVLVPQSGAQVAHDVLLSADLAPTRAATEPGGDLRRGLTLAAVILVGGLATALVAWLALGTP